MNNYDDYGRRKFYVGYKLYGGDFEFEQYETIYAISEDDAKQIIFGKYNLSEDSASIDFLEIMDEELERNRIRNIKWKQ
mgnify:CR=1 FL=1